MQNRFQKVVVLMLEDNESLLTANIELLKDENCDVHAAVSIAQARKIVKKVKPDLAILDIILPDGSGIDFASELRKKYPAAALIYLSAKTDIETRHAGLLTGAINYIPKPYDADDFKLIVRNVMNGIVAARPPLLRPVELTTAKLVISGQTNQEIADTLGVSKEAIKSRLWKIYGKLGIEGGDNEKREKLREVLQMMFGE